MYTRCGILNQPKEIIHMITDYLTCHESTNYALTFGTPALPQTDVPPDLIALSQTCRHLRECLKERASEGAVVTSRGTYLRDVFDAVYPWRPDSLAVAMSIQKLALANSPETMLRLEHYRYIKHLRLQGQCLPSGVGFDVLHQFAFDWIEDVPCKIETLSWNFRSWGESYIPRWPRNIGAHLRTLVLKFVPFNVLEPVHLPMVKSFALIHARPTLGRLKAFVDQMPNMVEFRIRGCKIEGLEDDVGMNFDEAFWRRLELLHMHTFEFFVFEPDEYVSRNFTSLRELQMTQMRLGAADLEDFAHAAHFPSLQTVTIEVYDCFTPGLFELLAQAWPNVERLAVYAECYRWQPGWSLDERKIRWFRDWGITEDISIWRRALSEFRHLKEFCHNNDPQDPDMPGVVTFKYRSWKNWMWDGGEDDDEDEGLEWEVEEEVVVEDKVDKNKEAEAPNEGEGKSEVEVEEGYDDDEEDTEEEDEDNEDDNSEDSGEDSSNDDAGDESDEDDEDDLPIQCTPSQSFQDSWNASLTAERDIKIGYSFRYPTSGRLFRLLHPGASS